MADILFYEKTGCISNRRQKGLLEASGHRLEVRNLLTERWTPEMLHPYLRTLPVPEWFNPSAPAIRSGEIRPETLSPDAALAALCAAPILIRRPLMAANGVQRAGFSVASVAAWVGLVDPDAAVTDRCARTTEPPSRS